MRQIELKLCGVLFASFAILAGCSGGSDHRPPTIVAGNVRSASAATASQPADRLWRLARNLWRGEARAQVPGITVSIEASSNSTTTDSHGFFRLEGNQFGPAVLEFAGNGADAELAVTLPSGGELDLLDVVLSGANITVGEQRLHFDGPITGIDCQANLLQVLSGEQVAFRVRLQSSTALVDQDGAPIRCGDLSMGGVADVQGTVDSNGDVEARQIQVNPPPNATPTPRTVHGTIASLDCPTDLSLARDQGGTVTVNIGSSTQIRDSGGMALQCSDLSTGDGVRVEGTENSFGIDASTIERVATATPTPKPTRTP